MMLDPIPDVDSHDLPPTAPFWGPALIAAAILWGLLFLVLGSL